MPRKFKFCFHCRRTIAENEVKQGLFVRTPQGLLCATCAQQLDEETEAAKQLAAGQAPVPGRDVFEQKTLDKRDAGPASVQTFLGLGGEPIEETVDLKPVLGSSWIGDRCHGVVLGFP